MKIEKGSVVSLIVTIVVYVLVGFALFPLFDWILDTVFTKSPFVYSVSDHIITPAIICSIVAVVTWIIERRKVNQEKKK